MNWECHEQSARKAMRELGALRIANVSSTSGYANSELTLILNDKFRWFLSEEFQNLRDDTDGSATTIHCQNNIESTEISLPVIAKTQPNFYYPIQKLGDSNCHTLKLNLPRSRYKKSIKVR